MSLPVPLSEDSIDVPSSPLVSSASKRKALDKSIVDKALTISFVEHADEVVANLISLANAAESEQVRLNANLAILERVAGKAQQTINHQGITATVLLSPEDLSGRLAHLKNKYVEAKSYQENSAGSVESGGEEIDGVGRERASVALEDDASSEAF